MVLRLFSVLRWAQVREGEYVVFSNLFLTGQAEVDREFPTRSHRDIVSGWTEKESNKFGIEIDRVTWEHDIAGKEIIVHQGKELDRIVKVQNQGDAARTLEAVSLSQNPQDAFVITPDRVLPFELAPGSTLAVKVQCRCQDIGVLRTAMTFSFRSAATREPQASDAFEIHRRIKVRCGDSDLADLLKPTAPYVKQRRKLRRFGKDIEPVEGEQLPAEASLPAFKNKLQQFAIPDRTRKLWKEGAASQVLAPIRAAMTPASYRELFDHLLWLEEISMEFDITNFDMDGATLTREGSFLVLVVPGLAENRPSVLRGDFLIANPAGNLARKFKGYAHRVERDRVLLKFHRDFHSAFIPGQRFDISFSFRRTPLRLMHHGLSLTAPIAKTLFPTASVELTGGVGFPGLGPDTGSEGLNVFNRSLNAEQRQAVCNIVRSTSRPMPYLVFGPPGTGKTVTLVEAVLQMWKCKRHVKILVTAPSNTAADVVLARLTASVPPSEMLRFMAFNRPPSEVTDAVKQYTTMDASGQHFEQPPLSALMQYRIVVATCTMAAKLHHIGIPRGHFEMLVIDEAGHAWEPECVAGIAGLAPDNDEGLVVLAGDPKQLGPVVRSPLARELGLGESFLERLMNDDMFSRRADGQYDHRVLTKLVKNYRSHPQILALPNELFYANELEALADPELVGNMCSWEHIPAPARERKFPLVFHGVQGEEERESNSPSWFNREEITVVLRYVKHLLYDARSFGIQPKDIGVITPYAKHAEKLRLAFRAEQMSEVMVGSTEQFQGQEKHVTIISTVRSSDEYIPFDLKHNIGFLNNPKRFNVAVTRAKGLLIVVGNPAVLARDEHWGKLLWFIVDGGGYTGPPLPERDPEAGHWAREAQSPSIASVDSSGSMGVQSDSGSMGSSNMGVRSGSLTPMEISGSSDEEAVIVERGEGVVDQTEQHAWRAAD